MTDSIEISKVEINPNRLRSHTKVPLPDFAIAALDKNGFTYDCESPYTSQSQQHLQQQTNKCKLTEHLQHVKCHINKDGPRVWDVRVDRNDGNKQHSESSAGDGVKA
jgi:hypothetical protein